MGGALRVKGLAQTNNKMVLEIIVCPLAKACEAATSSAFNHLFIGFFALRWKSCVNCPNENTLGH